MYKIPHVIVFSNDNPDKSKLSDDRWDVVKLLSLDNIAYVIPMEHISENEMARREELERIEQEDADMMALLTDDTSNSADRYEDAQEMSTDDDELPNFHLFNANRYTSN